MGSGDHRRPARRDGPGHDPGCSWRARRKASLLPANATAAARALPSGEGLQKTAARQHWRPSEVVGGARESRGVACSLGDGCARRRAVPARRRPGSGSQDAGCERGPGGRKMPAARRTRGRPLSPGWAPLKKPPPVTGRERRQPRARTASPSRAHTPRPAATAYLPRGPASFLSRARAAAAASSAHGSDAPLPRLHPPAFSIRARRRPAARPPASLAAAAASSNSTPAARDSSPRARSSSARCRLRPRPRPARPAPEPAPTSARVPAPLRWRRALRRCPSPLAPASRPAGPWGGALTRGPFPSPVRQAPRSPSAPAAGMPGPPGARAASAEERSGSASSEPARLLPARCRAGCWASPRREAAGLGEVGDKLRLTWRLRL